MTPKILVEVLGLEKLGHGSLLTTLLPFGFHPVRNFQVLPPRLGSTHPVDACLGRLEELLLKTWFGVRDSL